MKTLPELVPNPDELLAIQPEELAGLIMVCLNSRKERLEDPVSIYDMKLDGLRKWIKKGDNQGRQ